jgi:proteasome alpha subunit
MLFGGVDKKGSRLFWADPSGAFFAYRAWAIGAGGDAANEILEAEYRDNLTMDEALLLGMKCMTKVLEGKAEPQKIRVAIIPRETGKFQKLPVEEVDKYLRRMDASKKAPAGK